MSPLIFILGGFALIVILGAGVAIFAGGRSTAVDERLGGAPARGAAAGGTAVGRQGGSRVRQE